MLPRLYCFVLPVSLVVASVLRNHGEKRWYDPRSAVAVLRSKHAMTFLMGCRNSIMNVASTITGIVLYVPLDIAFVSTGAWGQTARLLRPLTCWVFKKFMQDLNGCSRHNQGNSINIWSCFSVGTSQALVTAFLAASCRSARRARVLRPSQYREHLKCIYCSHCSCVA